MTLQELTAKDSFKNLPEGDQRELLMLLDVGSTYIPTTAGFENIGETMAVEPGIAPICLNNQNEINGNSQKIARMEGVISGFTEVLSETKENTEKILKEMGELKIQAALDRQANEARFIKWETDIKNVADIARQAHKKIDAHIRGELECEVSELKGNKSKKDDRSFSTRQIIYTSIVSGVAVGVVVLVITLLVGG